jgi:hypothetical protein
MVAVGLFGSFAETVWLAAGLAVLPKNTTGSLAFASVRFPCSALKPVPSALRGRLAEDGARDLVGGRYGSRAIVCQDGMALVQIL